MKKLILIFVTVLLIGCGREDDLKVTTADDLRQYFDYFMEHAEPGRYALDDRISLQWGEPPHGKAGWCEIDGDELYVERASTVTIRPASHGVYLRVLVAHELAHCLFDADHESDPASLMAPGTGMDEAYWEMALPGEIKRVTGKVW